MSNHEPAAVDLKRYPGFHCFKSGDAIHYPRRWQRDALIQAALDPVVTSLDPLEPGSWPPGVEFAFKATINSTVFICLLSDTKDRHLFDSYGGAILRLSRAALRVEPLCSTGRAVWSRKRLTIDPAVRYKSLEAASARAEGAPAKAVLAEIAISQSNPIDQLLAMLAQGVLTADLSSGLRGTTLLRPGPSFESQSESNPRQRLHKILTSRTDEPCR